MKRINSSLPEDSLFLPFQESVNLLFEELALAVQWKRPSILFVFYDQAEARVDAELSLEKRLGEIRQQALPFEVDEQSFDVPLALSRHAERRRTVYFVSGLGRGGGYGGKNAYRALNMRRELLVDRCVRAVFWLTGEEAVALSRHAPDFWAFRHRVVELGNITRDEPAFPEELPDWGELRLARNIKAKIALRQSLLTCLPQQERALPKRIHLLLALAGLCWALGEYQNAALFLKQGEQSLQQMKSAVSSARYRAKAWRGIGQAYYILGRIPDAIIAYQQATALDPADLQTRLSLAACLRLSGQNDQMMAQMRLIEPMIREASEYHRASFEAIFGHQDEAVRLLICALRKRQVGRDQMDQQPALEFIRDDPRLVTRRGKR